jgi:hypothetical protein
MEFRVYETTKDISGLDITLHLVQLNEEVPEEQSPNVLQLARRIQELCAKNSNGEKVGVICAAPPGVEEFIMEPDGTVMWTRGLSSDFKLQLFAFLSAIAKENAHAPHPAEG